MISQHIGQRIQDLRKDYKITQVKFAEKIGIWDPVISALPQQWYTNSNNNLLIKDNKNISQYIIYKDNILFLFLFTNSKFC
jgi:transcriptional regulator with XRE-family HTH domain